MLSLMLAFGIVSRIGIVPRDAIGRGQIDCDNPPVIVWGVRSVGPHGPGGALRRRRTASAERSVGSRTAPAGL